MAIKKYSAEDIPLLEFDPDKTALIEPHHNHQNQGLPEYCVLPFYQAVIEQLKNQGRLEPIYTALTDYFPIEMYSLDYNNKFITVAYAGLGGAPATVGLLERLIALGCRKFVFCGWCGVLKPELKNGVIIIPAVAVRDEGTSYHYVAPSRVIEMDGDVVNKLETILQKHHVIYEIGRNWTTDAFYRETRGKIAKRKAEGCISVDMECSALLAALSFAMCL